MHLQSLVDVQKIDLIFYNLWAKIGRKELAGQTIFHAHIHIITRRDGDTPNPTGGVRGVIPDKMCYILEE